MISGGSGAEQRVSLTIKLMLHIAWMLFRGLPSNFLRIVMKALVDLATFL